MRTKRRKVRFFTCFRCIHFVLPGIRPDLQSNIMFLLSMCCSPKVLSSAELQASSAGIPGHSQDANPSALSFIETSQAFMISQISSSACRNSLRDGPDTIAIIEPPRHDACRAIGGQAHWRNNTPAWMVKCRHIRRYSLKISQVRFSATPSTFFPMPDRLAQSQLAQVNYG